MYCSHTRAVYTTGKKWYRPVEKSIGNHGPKTVWVFLYRNIASTVPLFNGSVAFFTCHVNSPKVAVLRNTMMARQVSQHADICNTFKSSVM